MRDAAESAAPLEWRVAAGHRLVELDYIETELIDVWVLNIWKEYGDLPPVAAVNTWYSTITAAEAEIKAGTHPYITPEISWAMEYKNAWSELVFGECDLDATMEDAYESYKSDGNRPAKVVAQEHFDRLDQNVKARYASRVRVAEKTWIPPTV